MKLHEQTIARAERTYVNKAEAYFWGLAAGYLTGIVSFNAFSGFNVLSYPRRKMKFDKETEKEIRARIKWLQQKEDAQRNPRSVDHTGSELLIGRTQGEIGALQGLLRRAGLKA